MSGKSRPSNNGKAKQSSRTTEADQRRARLEAMRAEQRRGDRRRKTVTLVAGGLGLITVVGLMVLAVATDNGDGDVESAASEVELPGVATYTPEAGHVSTPVEYQQTPPAGGRHDPAWLNCGTYTEPVRSENAVHAMEHGAVWVTYRPDLPKAQVDKLKSAMPETFGVLSPHPDLTAPVVASAWGRQLPLTGPDDPRLAEFIRTYRLGSQAPEPGAPCTGGVG